MEPLAYLVWTTKVSELTVLRPGSSEKSIHMAQPDFSSMTLGADEVSSADSVSGTNIKNISKIRTNENPDFRQIKLA